MLMRRRLYFVLPDIESARAMLNDMLLARIECRHIHFLSRRDTLPDDLPQANVLQKTDIVHGAQVGVAIDRRGLTRILPAGRRYAQTHHRARCGHRGCRVRGLGVEHGGELGAELQTQSVSGRDGSGESVDDGRCAHAARAGDLRARRTSASGGFVRRFRADDSGLPVS
jgi:hypothetical protein